MKIFLFGGTTEGREILKSGLPVIYSAATDYGAELASKTGGNAEIHAGRLDVAAMESVFAEREIAGVIDATHPHATEVSRNIRMACERAGIPCVRVVRRLAEIEGGNVTAVSSCAEAAQFLNGAPLSGQNVLLAVGSKELACFTKVEDYKKRLFVRVLPTEAVLSECEKMGFDAGHIIAMQGPFSVAMNRAMLEMTSARVLVTKDSGVAGGLEEKLQAARECGVGVLLIRRPEETGMTTEEAVRWGFQLLKGNSPKKFPPFPFFCDIARHSAVVVGGGPVALRRVRTLLECGARVRVISPAFDAAFEGLIVERLERVYREGDLDGAVLALAATNDREVNRRVGEDARRKNIPVSVADASEECTFFFPALVARGDIAAGISTGGRSPGLSKRLSGRLREIWPDWVAEEENNEEGCR